MFCLAVIAFPMPIDINCHCLGLDVLSRVHRRCAHWNVRFEFYKAYSVDILCREDSKSIFTAVRYFIKSRPEDIAKCNPRNGFRRWQEDEIRKRWKAFDVFWLGGYCEFPGSVSSYAYFIFKKWAASAQHTYMDVKFKPAIRQAQNENIASHGRCE